MCGRESHLFSQIRRMKCTQVLFINYGRLRFMNLVQSYVLEVISRNYERVKCN